MKEYRKYNKSVILFVIGLLLFVISINYFINPYNIFSDKLNLLKPEAKKQERITKIIGLKVNKNNLDVAFAGTSRVDLAISSDYYKKLTGKNAVNIAMGGLNMDEYSLLIKELVNVHPEIKTVYLGVDFAAFREYEKVDNNEAEINQNKNLELSEIAVSLLSLTTFGDSVWTVVKKITNIKRRMYYSDGTKYIFKNPDIQREIGDSLLEYGSKYKNYKISDKQMNYLDEIIATCNKNNIKPVLFIMPSHITDINLIYETGVWDTYWEWKKEMVTRGNVLDFQYPNKYTEEAIQPDMKYFFDASHASNITGNDIIQSLIGNKKDFGRTLTLSNIEYNKQLATHELVNWRKDNKYIVDIIKKFTGVTNAV